MTLQQPLVMATGNQFDRKSLSDSFNRGVQSLEEATESARSMSASLGNKLLVAPTNEMTASITIDHETKTTAFTSTGTLVELYRLLAKEWQGIGQEVPKDLGALPQKLHRTLPRNNLNKDYYESHTLHGRISGFSPIHAYAYANPHPKVEPAKRLAFTVNVPDEFIIGKVDAVLPVFDTVEVDK